MKVENRSKMSIEARSTVWARILEALWRRGSVEAGHVTDEVDATAREIQRVCREMADMGWLKAVEGNAEWVAGDRADELLNRYPTL